VQGSVNAVGGGAAHWPAPPPSFILRVMATYDLDLESKRPSAKRGLGCAIAGWAMFAVLLGVVGFFGYRVWFYYGQIRRGELVELPQFRSNFTSSGASAAVGSANPDRQVVEAGDHPAEGPAADVAKLTIVQFADFQCPFSKEEATVVRTLMRKYGDRVRFVYRDYPLVSIHPDATQASLAAECAREQGKFWAYHDKLYLNSPSLGFQDLVRYAEEIGVDTRQFERCLVDERYRDKVEEDRALAERLGLRGTPTFFFNGQRVEGAVPEDVFENLIEKMVK
jgi:protein-disulfide isomerase